MGLECGIFINKTYSANKFAVTGANKFANAVHQNSFVVENSCRS
jgi:hypothetical protein